MQIVSVCHYSVFLLFQLLEKAAKNFAFQETVIENSTTVIILKFFFHSVLKYICDVCA